MELPTGPAKSASLPEAPPCPFCDRSETELLNAFGSHASVSTYWCRPCRSPFEIFKWRPEAPQAPQPSASSEGAGPSESRAGPEEPEG